MATSMRPCSFAKKNPNDGSNIAREAESVDLDDLLAEMPNLNNFDCEQFFVSENPVDFFEMAF
jgi:hypothetical protein